LPQNLYIEQGIIGIDKSKNATRHDFFKSVIYVFNMK
jgi:hypothetical protein